jgi:putative endonuclease
VCPETTTAIGRRGEDAAARHLESHGLQLLERNYRCRGGEIDLVMLEGNTLVLVEVRLRTSGGFGGAAASVGSRKQRRFTLAARHLMMTRPAYRKLQARFDVVALEAGAQPGETRIDWIRDAFRIGG